MNGSRQCFPSQDEAKECHIGRGMTESEVDYHGRFDVPFKSVIFRDVKVSTGGYDGIA